MRQRTCFKGGKSNGCVVLAAVEERNDMGNKKQVITMYDIVIRDTLVVTYYLHYQQ